MNRHSKTKLKKYELALKKVGTYCDGLGLPVDRGIRKTVALLNLLGHKTSASCEGHLDLTHGILVPWVDVEFGKSDRARKELRLRKLLRSFWQYRYRTHADRKFPDGRSLHMEELGIKKHRSIRIVSRLEWELFAQFRDKKKMPLPVRTWFHEEGKKAMREFSAYLSKVYFGEEKILKNPPKGSSN